MSKLLTTLLAAVFATVTVIPVAFAAKHEMDKKQASAVATACKGKKPGDMVKVEGKDVKCPAPAAAKK